MLHSENQTLKSMTQAAEDKHSLGDGDRSKNLDFDWLEEFNLNDASSRCGLAIDTINKKGSLSSKLRFQRIYLNTY